MKDEGDMICGRLIIKGDKNVTLPNYCIMSEAGGKTSQTTVYEYSC